MGAIAKSAGENMKTEHLSQLITALLNGLSGRTWSGKVRREICGANQTIITVVLRLLK